MIKVKVTRDNISITGHAGYAESGKDIVCSAVSSVVSTSIEGISLIDNDVLDVKTDEGMMLITIKKHTEVGDKLIINMINCLTEIEKQYPKNIKITNREE